MGFAWELVWYLNLSKFLLCRVVVVWSLSQLILRTKNQISCGGLDHSAVRMTLSKCDCNLASVLIVSEPSLVVYPHGNLVTVLASIYVVNSGSDLSVNLGINLSPTFL